MAELTKRWGMRAPETIVVGIDGSPGAAEAVRWAAIRAARGSARLRLIHVSTPAGLAAGAAAAPAMPMTAVPGSMDVELQDRAERALLDSAAEAVRSVDESIEVGTERVIGTPGAALVEASGRASLVVLGSRGLGAVAGLVLGSVGVHVSSHAACPTVIVHGIPDRSGPVLAGVEEDFEGATAVVTFALREARRLGVGLVAVHSAAQPLPTGAGEAAAVAGLAEGRVDAAEVAGHLFVDDLLEPLRGGYPDVPVEVVVTTQDEAAKALLERAAGASLIVVGSHGRGNLAGLVLGSTSQSVLRRASCPVAVIRVGDLRASRPARR